MVGGGDRSWEGGGPSIEVLGGVLAGMACIIVRRGNDSICLLGFGYFCYEVISFPDS